MAVLPTSGKSMRVISGEAVWSMPSPALTLTTNAAIDGASSIVPKATPPTTDTTNGKYVKGIGDQSTLTLVKFIGTNAANETLTAMVRGWYRCPADSEGTVYYEPVHFASLAVTLGAVQLASNVGEFTTNLFWADTITVSTDYSRGDLAKVYGDIADGIAVLAVDTCGAHYIEVECAVGTATGVSPIIGQL